jgi:hypothetical protein
MTDFPKATARRDEDRAEACTKRFVNSVPMSPANATSTSMTLFFFTPIRTFV